MFPVDDTYIEILESATLGTRFSLEVASDQDVGRNDCLSKVTMFQRIIISKKWRTHTIVVMAMDGGSPPRSGIPTVYVKVIDFNDNRPIFLDSFTRVELYEEAELNATDPDEGTNGADFEKNTFYKFKICTIRIDILDVNDNAPEIVIELFEFDRVAYITESAAESSFVSLISPMDSDSGFNGYVRCSLYGHDQFRLQQAYGGTHMIVTTTTTTLNREILPEYNLTVVEMDFVTPLFKTTVKYTIRVSKENDNAPTFSKSFCEVWVEENNVVVDTFLRYVLANELDLGQNPEITYRLINGSALAFYLELTKEIDVQIQASDGGYPVLSNTTLDKSYGPK
ncbi:unnamed protein product [Coregonus sp. 'balchen']|nr:unnamed protein product [Coregonus sp. 'balchen']